ncbi:DedA family protein [Micromonospora sp. NPDC050417]|uniref:DedA family protein n=1 Tax=Micromonospora sp. NPDC050417 TaxID=3364280 RepID=UPI0037BBB3D4
MPELLTNVASPASAYLALFVLLVVDAFVPVVPTQVIMITGGALTIYGNLNLPLTIAVGALGVFCGDTACYLLGRVGAGRLLSGWRLLRDRYGPATSDTRTGAGPDRSRPAGLPAEPDEGAPDSTGGSRSRQAAGRFTRALRQPGPLVILLCRFVPGGRMIACFNAGRVRYPYRRFLAYDALAAVGWAAYGALVGHLGGAALTDSVWRLATVAVLAAAGFAAAGWALTLTNGRAAGKLPAPEPALAASGITATRAASTDGPPR